MKKPLPILFILFLTVIANFTLAFSQEAAQSFILIPAGEMIIIMGQTGPEATIAGFRIYKKKEGEEFKQLAELPLWKRDPNILLEVLGKEEFEKLAEKYACKTPAELIHKSADDAGIYFSLMALTPLYPKLLTLINDNTYIFFDENIEVGAKYEYAVKSLDSGGTEKEVLPTLKATGGDKDAPIIPQDIKVEAGDKEVNLSWKRTEGDRIGNTDAVYYIYRKSKIKNQKSKIEGQEEDFKIITYVLPPPKIEQAYADRGLVNGVEYTYKLSAISIVGVESEHSKEFKVTPHDLTPPAPPGNISAKFESDKVKISWDASKEEDLAHYNIYRTHDTTVEPKKINEEDIKVTEFTDKTMELNGATYLYSVTTIDKAGNESIKPAPQFVTVSDHTPPDPPTNIKAEYNKEENIVKLTWEHSPSEDFTVYPIFKGKSKENMALIDTLRRDKTEYIDKHPQGDKTLYYSIKAQDVAGNVSETKEIIEVKIPDKIVPPSPYGLAVEFKEGEKGLSLKWVNVKADDFKEYIVYRSTEVPVREIRQTEEERKKGFQKIASISQEEYFDEDVQKGVTYWYIVSQLDESGNESKVCNAMSSNVIDTEPPAVPVDISASFETDGIHLSWKANTEDDLAGYNVYLVDLFRFTENKVTEKPIKETEFLLEYTEVGDEGNVGVKLSAIDTSNNESKKTSLVKPK